jgi:FkbM family methyltransferase
VFFDVGANLGFFALLASRRVGLTGEVHAFEPAPEQFGQLRRNIELNRAVNVRLNNCALADSPGLRAFYLSAGWNRGTHSFGSTPERRSSIQVTCETFDDYVTRRGLHHVDVVKIDVEGAELLVLRGARACIRSQPPSLMIVEAAQAHAQSLGYSTIDLKAYLAENGYEIYRLHRASKPVQAAIGTAESYANLAAIHQTAPARYRDALFGSWAQSGTGAAQPPSKD